MLAMDVFTSDAFSATSLSAAVDTFGYVPSFLQGLPGLFTPVPIRTTEVWIEKRGNTPALIQTSARGAPPKQKSGDIRTARAFNTVRLGIASRIMASELQNIRAFGSETELKQLQMEVARRQFKIKQDMTLTMENLLLGTIQGTTTDADASTIYAWDTEFGQTIPAEVGFDLSNASPASGIIRQRCNTAIRSIIRGLAGLGGTGVRVAALCGDTFFDLLTMHPEVRQSYVNWAAAAELRSSVGVPFQSFNFGNIDWYNYRSTDDGSTVAITTTQAKFFPVGAGIFQIAYAPAERFEFVNTLGQEMYSWMVTDDDRNAWADVEMYSYPLPVCVQPQALYRARSGA